MVYAVVDQPLSDIIVQVQLYIHVGLIWDVKVQRNSEIKWNINSEPPQGEHVTRACIGKHTFYTTEMKDNGVCSQEIWAIAEVLHRYLKRLSSFANW